MAITRITSPAITSVSSTSISGTLPAANINDTSIGNITALPAGVGGKVLQVVETAKTDTFTASVAQGAYTDITGLSVSITPSSTSNKILILAKIDGGACGGRPQYYRLLRDSTVIGSGVDEGNRQGNSFSSGAYSGSTRSMISGSLNFLDSPTTTSAITYKISVSHELGSAGTVNINRSSLDDDGNYTHRGISIITAIEIAG